VSVPVTIVASSQDELVPFATRVPSREGDLHRSESNAQSAGDSRTDRRHCSRILRRTTPIGRTLVVTARKRCAPETELSKWLAIVWLGSKISTRCRSGRAPTGARPADEPTRHGQSRWHSSNLTEYTVPFTKLVPPRVNQGKCGDIARSKGKSKGNS